MKRFVLGLSSLLIISCATHPLAVSKTDFHNLDIDSTQNEDTEILSIIQPYKRQLDEKMNVVLATSGIELTKFGDTPVLNNLLADYTLNAGRKYAASNAIAQPDFAIINGGGIRNIIPKGNITVRSVFEVMPFENEMVIVELKGKELEKIFTYYTKTKKDNPVSGIMINTLNPSLNKLTNGRNITPEDTYRIVTSDYLAEGGDNMEFFKAGKVITTGIKLRDAYIEEFRNSKTIPDNYPYEKRLIF